MTDPGPFWNLVLEDVNRAHETLDTLGAPRTKRVHRRDPLQGYQEITLSLSERIVLAHENGVEHGKYLAAEADEVDR